MKTNKALILIAAVTMTAATAIAAAPTTTRTNTSSAVISGSSKGSTNSAFAPSMDPNMVMSAAANPNSVALNANVKGINDAKLEPCDVCDRNMADGQFPPVNKIEVQADSSGKTKDAPDGKSGKASEG